ncbi:MAG: hypothetical protein ABR927_18900 [Bacteroidales bacterium]
MNGNNGIRTDKIMKKGAKVINRDIAVFAFFLFLSFIFWYFNSLGKENEAGIKYQVKYTNIPKEKLITSEQPTDLNIFLKGPGYSILKLKISGKREPLIIDLSKVSYKRTPGDKALDYYIVTSGLTKNLNAQIRSGCEITSIKPDTLFFSLDKVIANSSVIPDNKYENKKKR